MATVLKKPQPRTRTHLSRPELDAVLLDLGPGGSAYFNDVPWNIYDHLLRLRDNNRPGVRLTYDAGRLEFMTVTYSHESWKTILTNLLVCFAMETGRTMCPAGNLTVRRKDVLKGLEPDDCFYVQNATSVIELRELNIAVDPPPDLAIEVEKSRTVVRRLPIYAALGVPEVWRFIGRAITVLLLQPNGKYAPATESRAFPALDMAVIVRHVRMLGSTDQMTILRRFQTWVRERVLRTPKQ